MEFGPVSIADAAGTILAHSLHAGSTRLRKGTRLSQADVDALISAGIDQVTVARLGPGDIHEDAAALRLAESLIAKDDPGVELTKPFTGRVNLLAKTPGLVRIDRERLHAVNAVDPMISCATVAPLTRMDAGGMIATVKIISYGVAESALTQATELAQEAIGLSLPVLKTARLIVSATGAGPKPSAGLPAIEGRLHALGVTLTDIVHVAHREDEIAQAMSGAPVDITLVLTGSATSDPFDTAPEALRRAGGQVTRFGMPVDPGNLLFLGALQGRAVVGLPGCARSPALNGADWVLERLICGVPVTDDDIARMGVGGLLKEIPQRPQPRRG